MTTTKTYSLQQILAGWIVNNNPSAVRQVLINNSLISGTSSLSKSAMANILYSYYLTNGNTAFLNLLKQIPVNPNTSAKDKAALANTYEEIKSSYGGASIAPYVSNARVGEASADKWWNDVIDVVLGKSTTTTPPTVTTTTTTSPFVIGGLIAAVSLVLGLAYFLIGRRTA